MIAASLKRIPLPSIDAQLLAVFLLLMGWGLVIMAISYLRKFLPTASASGCLLASILILVLA